MNHKEIRYRRHERTTSTGEKLTLVSVNGKAKFIRVRPDEDGRVRIGIKRLMRLFKIGHSF